jgi:hypothetical protein
VHWTLDERVLNRINRSIRTVYGKAPLSIDSMNSTDDHRENREHGGGEPDRRSPSACECEQNKARLLRDLSAVHGEIVSLSRS